MFKHILMPIDGTLTMVPTVRRCLHMASEMGAQVEAVHVLASAPAGGDRDAPGAALARAHQILQMVESEAAAMGVPCVARIADGVQPWQAIVAAASAGGADLICMSSHGRLAAAGAALGSQTAQVLTHATVPVLVLR